MDAQNGLPRYLDVVELIICVYCAGFVFGNGDYVAGDFFVIEG